MVLLNRNHFSESVVRKTISSGSPLEAPIGFSRACRIGHHIAVSGTAPIKDGQTVFYNDVYQQTKYCLALSIAAIEEAGGSLSGVIRTRVMLTDITKWQEAAKAHGELFAELKPACTFVEVSGFIDKEWLVETEVDCIVNEQNE